MLNIDASKDGAGTPQKGALVSFPISIYVHFFLWEIDHDIYAKESEDMFLFPFVFGCYFKDIFLYVKYLNPESKKESKKIK